MDFLFLSSSSLFSWAFSVSLGLFLLSSSSLFMDFLFLSSSSLSQDLLRCLSYLSSFVFSSNLTLGATDLLLLVVCMIFSSSVVSSKSSMFSLISSSSFDISSSIFAFPCSSFSAFLFFHSSKVKDFLELVAWSFLSLLSLLSTTTSEFILFLWLVAWSFLSLLSLLSITTSEFILFLWLVAWSFLSLLSATTSLVGVGLPSIYTPCLASSLRKEHANLESLVASRWQKS